MQHLLQWMKSNWYLAWSAAAAVGLFVAWRRYRTTGLRQVLTQVPLQPLRGWAIGAVIIGMLVWLFVTS